MERIRWCGAGALVRKGFSRPNGTFVRLLPFPASKRAGYFRRVRPGRARFWLRRVPHLISNFLAADARGWSGFDWLYGAAKSTLGVVTSRAVAGYFQLFLAERRR